MKFFETSTRNLLAYKAAAIGRAIALLYRLVEPTSRSKSGYFRVKIVQEKLIKEPLIATPLRK